jgi:hypothetical protein
VISVADIFYGHTVIAKSTTAKPWIDVTHSENEPQRLRQTSELASSAFIRKLERKNKNLQRWAEVQGAHSQAIAAMEPQPHPYAPAIDLYLR